MKLTIEAAVPAYPQITAQQLKIGECVRYKAGNGVVRITDEDYLSFDSDGRIIGTTKYRVILSHGQGDLLPQGTTLTITL